MDIKELKVDKTEKQNHPWEFARLYVIKDILKGINAKTVNKNILDIGSGDLFFITHFAGKMKDGSIIAADATAGASYKLAPNVLKDGVIHAVDTAYDNDLVSLLQNKYINYNIKFYQSIDDLKGIEKVSVVFLLDVLEHIEKDMDFLEQVAEIQGIDSDTLFVISVPAYQRLFCSHDQWIGHYRRYSGTSLTKLIQAANLSCIQSGYFFFSLIFPRLCKKVFERFFRNLRNAGIGDWNGSKFTTDFYKNILITDYRISKMLRRIGVKLPGLSTYIICQKPVKV